jgi:hypothetical protein
MQNPTIRLEVLNGSGKYAAWHTVCTTDFYAAPEDAVTRFCESTGIDASRVRATVVEG